MDLTQIAGINMKVSKTDAKMFHDRIKPDNDNKTRHLI